MFSLKSIAVAFTIVLFCAGTNSAYAQLWRYIGDTPEKEKAFEKYLKKEASRIVTKKYISDGDTMSYEITTYTIRSFDNQTSNINLWYQPMTNRIFHIDCGDDHLSIGDFTSLNRVHILRPNLLEIVYSPRGGSDFGVDNVLILGINKGKFCVAMEIMSVSEGDGPDKYGLYNLHFKLNGQNVDNYQMNIMVRDLLKSYKKTYKSHDLHFNYALKFDKERHVFYSDMENTDITINLWDAKGNKIKPRRVNGNFPVIKLGEEQYVFFDGVWYARYKTAPIGKYDYEVFTAKN